VNSTRTAMHQLCPMPDRDDRQASEVLRSNGLWADISRASLRKRTTTKREHETEMDDAQVLEEQRFVTVTAKMPYVPGGCLLVESNTLNVDVWRNFVSTTARRCPSSIPITPADPSLTSAATLTV
jgi:hypothetical protein